MKKCKQERTEKLLRQALLPVEPKTIPGRDLWPMLRRLCEESTLAKASPRGSSDMSNDAVTTSLDMPGDPVSKDILHRKRIGRHQRPTAKHG